MNDQDQNLPAQESVSKESAPVQESPEEFEMIPDEDMGGFRKKAEDLREKLAHCEAERKEYLEGWQRAKADLINYRKEEGRRFEEVMHLASASLLQEIIPVLDSFDSALGSRVSDEITRGVVLIRSQLEEVLRRYGLESFKTEAGEPFDPARHESISEIESVHPPGTIAQILQRGYMLHNKVLRPARVRIAKGHKEE